MRKVFPALLLLFSAAAHTQTNTPPVYEITTDTAVTQQLNPDNWQLLEDKSGKWTIEQVSQEPLSSHFHRRSTAPNGVDTVVNTYWIRYGLKNEMATDARISLEAIAEREDLYVRAGDSGWKHFVAGYLAPWEKRDELKFDGFIPVVLQPGEEVWVYKRIENKKPGIPSNYTVDFGNTEKIIKRDYVDFVESRVLYFGAVHLQEMFLEGLLVLAIIYNLAFYRLTGEREYLYFSLFLFFMATGRLVNPVGAYLYWWQPQLSQYMGYLVLSFGFLQFFLIQFLRTFFKTRLLYKRWDWLLVSLSVTAVATTIVFFFIDPFFAYNNSASPTLKKIFNLLWATIDFSLLITFFLFIRRKDTVTKLVIIGGSPLLLFWIIGNLTEAGLPPLGLGWLTFYRPIEVSCILWFVLFFSALLFMRFNRLRKENAQQALDNERLAKEKEIERSQLIEQQKVELEKQVAERTAELQESLRELKATQSQLIQSEKMASLGELTAGIAHEIQNPLNFVNNFSEVSIELINEQKEVMKEGDTEEAFAIGEEIKDNLQKINHHGRRADSIVKGMLEHSRTSKGEKQPTDINTLADEYLRLAYHGVRAKDKIFNSTIETHFDESTGRVNIIPQEIGRVLLNLFNNAFYAVNEKKQRLNGTFEPNVRVSTERQNGSIVLKVSDNGNGIPQNIIDKVFQPFFTTKPTGQGTGLGLSLSYDIVKAHGGELKVESKEGGGATFIISLPLS